MDSNLIGQGKNSEKADSASSTHGSSLAVRQFTAAAFGWVPVHSPSQPWRVVRVVADERYCLGCFGVRTFDVVMGVRRVVTFCRCCGAEVRSGY